MISTRSAGLVIDTVVCLTLVKWETVSSSGLSHALLQSLALRQRYAQASTVRRQRTNWKPRNYQLGSCAKLLKKMQGTGIMAHPAGILEPLSHELALDILSKLSEITLTCARVEESNHVRHLRGGGSRNAD